LALVIFERSGINDFIETDGIPHFVSKLLVSKQSLLKIFLPFKYLPSLTLLSFQDQTRSGTFRIVWL
jgi:hypothetical protein